MLEGTRRRRRPLGRRSALLELERRRVDAVALAGGGRAVGKDVTEVRVAALAHDLDALHPEAHVALERQVLLGDGVPEARPSGPRVVLFVGAEELGAAADACVRTRVFLVVVLAGERPLGALLPSHVKLHVGELLAPLGGALVDLVAHGHLPSRRRAFAAIAWRALADADDFLNSRDFVTAFLSIFLSPLER